MASALINVPAKAKRGDIIEIKTLMSHVMETGYRHMASGEIVPRDIITSFACRFNGKEIFRADLFPAIAANPFGKPNTAKTWKDVNPALPDMPIMVYGPATISGTRDALKELILTKACDSDAATKALKDTDKDKHDKICGDLRTDGAYADTSDNYNLIVQKLESNGKAVGIFGYSYLESNADKLQGLTMGGVAPSYESIANFTYPGARPLYIYVKKAHVGAIPGLKEYVAEWTKLWGKDGPLAKAGMIAMPEALQATNAKVATDLTNLDPAALK